LIARNVQNFAALSESFCVLTAIYESAKPAQSARVSQHDAAKIRSRERRKYRHALHYSPFVAHPAIN
jgi:hypothetical protein